jgi:nucleotide-binding universal stress UspA family protein
VFCCALKLGLFLSAPTRQLILLSECPQTSDNVLEWAIKNIYREGDDFHLLHVIPVPMPQVVGGFGAMDSIVTVEPDPQTDLKHIAEAKEMMKSRFIPKLATRNIPYQVEIVHFLTDADSIGEAICKRADALNAAAVCMAKHQRGAISEFFLGSTTKYCTTHMKAPLIVLH